MFLKYILFLIVLLSISCSNSYKLRLTDKINPKTMDTFFTSQADYMQTKEAKARKIISGTQLLKNDMGFKLCLEDRDLNGHYFDFGVDAIGIAPMDEDAVLIFTHYSDSIYFGSGSLLKNNLTFNYQEQKFAIEEINTENKSIKFKRLTSVEKNHHYDFLISDQLQNITFHDLFTDEKSYLYEKLDRDKKWHLIVFWTDWCPPCIEDFPLLNELSEKYDLEQVHLLNPEFSHDISDAQGIVKKHAVTGLHGISDKYIDRIFHQNGFPFMVLYDNNLKKISRLGMDDLIQILEASEVR